MVIKFLTRELIPRFGIPSQITSDNGSAFVQRRVKKSVTSVENKTEVQMCITHNHRKWWKELMGL